ncbi:MAG: hypothetical protein EXR75_01080 [Myxococcales bacterium]|nr:hypothetical protein [Myxococcales bacterium]
MFALFVMVAPLVVGGFLIMLIARYAPNVNREPGAGNAAEHDDRPEITSEEFRDLIEEFVAARGLRVVFSSMGTGGVVELTLRDERPLTGGRFLLQASPVLDGAVEAVDVLGFAEGVRADMGALKGIMMAVAGFTDEARTAVTATPAPVELVDGEQLLVLVRNELGAERAEELAAYRGFGARVRPSGSEKASAEDDGEP